MACTLTAQILGLTGPDGSIVTLVVKGTASCGEVKVTVDKTDPPPVVTLGPVTTTVNASTSQWQVAFAVGQDFRRRDFVCGSVKLVVHVECVDDKDCHDDFSFDQLPCQPVGGDSCPVFGQPSFTEGDCDSQGRRAVTLSVPVTSAPSNTTLMWDFGDPSQPFPVPFDFTTSPVTDTFSYFPPGPFTARLIVASGPDCTPASITFNVTACGGQPCASSLTLRVVNVATGANVNTLQCLIPGRYQVQVTAPSDPGATFSWSINGAVQNGATGSSLDVNVLASDPARTVAVALTPANPNCGVLPGSVTLTPCPPRQPCPTRVTLQVVNTAQPNDPVDTSGCLAPGTYTIRATSPAGTGLQFSWSVNGELATSSAQNSFGFTLPDDGQSYEISVAVTQPGCSPISGAVDLKSCPCTGSISLAVTDSQGNPVNTGGCVSPGNYTVTATGSNLDDSDRSWSINGRDAGDGTRVPVSLQAATGCGAGAGDTTVRVHAAKKGCPDQDKAVTLRLCPEFVLCPSCWLLRLAIVFFTLVAGIALAIWICPEVLDNPAIPASAGFVAIGLAVAPWVALGAALVAVVLLAVWIFSCPLTWCFDWLPLIWQVLLGVGFAFIFFGTCPACTSLLFIGLGIFVAGIIAFGFWVGTCKPTMCTILFEIGSLGLVQVVISFLEEPLGICIILWGWLLLLIWNGLLNGIGWIGGVLNGCVRRN